MASETGQSLYEGLFIVDPGFANKDTEGAIQLCSTVLSKHKATIIRAELWGEQRLAYEVRKNKRGAYILVAFKVDSLKMQEIELECRLTERILRYLFVNRDGVPIEKWFNRYEAPKGGRKEADVEIEVDTEADGVEEKAVARGK
ncbi:MAG: 30S ribosomal protein S6 [Planctomycetes bacterium]|nr:30S ribosomal protein S6 [Planctomycetota bacterium]